MFRNRYVKLCLKVLIVVALFLLFFRWVDVTSFFDHLKKVDLNLLAIGCVLVLGVQLFKTIRFQYLSRALKAEPDFSFEAQRKVNH